DTEQKYREPLPLLVPFVGFDKLQDEAYIFPHHPVTREKPAANHKFVDISAPYTCLPPRLSGKEVKRDKRGEVVSLLVMLVFFGLGVFWLSRGEGPVESSVEALVPAPVVRPESVVVEEQEVSSVNECDFLTTLKYLPKSEMFSDNWFLQLVSEYQPVVKDFNYHRGVPSVYQPLDFNVLFFKDEQLVASTNSVELESFGWHSFRWSRGVFFVQKSYWVEDDSEGVVNQRETFLFLQTDVVPPTFSSTIAGLGEKKGLFDSVGLGD
ncbi:MAG: hypothetical protein SVR94_00390, partial [Pseudomonadota bacterium]|nr:hypothetical protein [Pseudomonadota bacterium]